MIYYIHSNRRVRARGHVRDLHVREQLQDVRRDGRCVEKSKRVHVRIGQPRGRPGQRNTTPKV